MRRPAGSVALLPLLLAACSAPPPEPVPLSMADPASPLPFRAAYAQEIQWGPAAVVRDIRARYTLGAVAPDRARLDSLAVAISTPHGRQIVSGRHLLGRTFRLTAAPSGGPPTYGADLPALELGPAHGESTPIGALLDYGFPVLPQGPVAVGDTWTGQTRRRQVEADVVVTADLTTEYRLVGFEVVDAVRCAEIEGVTRGRLEGADGDRSYRGALEERSSWCLDPQGGALVRMSSEAVSEGEISDGGERVGIETRTTVVIDRAGAS